MRLRSRPSKGTIFAILLIASLLSTVLGARAATAMRRPAQAVLAPFGEAGIYISTSAKLAVDDLLAETIPQDQARRLQAENQQLRGEVQGLMAKLDEHYGQLAAIQGMKDVRFDPVKGPICELIPARVIAADATPYGQTLLLSAGGAESGQPVITRKIVTDRAVPLPSNLRAVVQQRLQEVTSSVLVGRLLETGPFSARLQLVTDRGFRIRAAVQRQYNPTVPREIVNGPKRELLGRSSKPIPVDAAGDGTAFMVVEHAKAEDNIQAGDWLVTCSDEPLLPVQIPIGMVTEVKANHKQAGFVSLKIRPMAEPELLRSVMVVAPLDAGERKDSHR